MPAFAKSKNNVLISRITILAVVISLLSLLWISRTDIKEYANLGYLGIFVINFISNATVIFPVPGAASVVVGGAFWNPLIVGLVSGLGAAFGELFAYFIGFGGRGLLKTQEKENKWIKEVEKRFHHSGFLTTFVLSALPVPLFDIIGLIAGAMNYPVIRFFAATFLGRSLRNIILAVSGNRFLPL